MLQKWTYHPNKSIGAYMIEVAAMRLVNNWQREQLLSSPVGPAITRQVELVL